MQIAGQLPPAVDEAAFTTSTLCVLAGGEVFVLPVGGGGITGKLKPEHT